MWSPANHETEPLPGTGISVEDFNQVIIVENNGKRFVDEQATAGDDDLALYEAFLNLSDRPRNVWVVADQPIVEAQEWDVAAIENPIDTFPCLASDRVAIADTIEELAATMGVDAQGLADEVARYNAFVDAGADEDFGKEELPNKIETEPFYALKMIIFGQDQQAGLTVNTKGQVVKRSTVTGPIKPLDDREVIPRLYAAGEVCGGYFGQERGNQKIDVHMYWGRIAGINAAKEVAV